MSRISASAAGKELDCSKLSLGMIWAVTVGTGMLLIGTPVASAEQTATEAVRGTIDEVIHILNSEELSQPDRSEERRQKIEQVIREHVNYRDMAKWALGLSWRELSDIERQEFVALFVQLLRDTVAGRIDNYVDEQVLYLAEQHEENCAEVRTKLSGRKTDTLLDFA